MQTMQTMQTMLFEPMPAHGVMEGNGAYNKHAKLPAGRQLIMHEVHGRLGAS